MYDLFNGRETKILSLSLVKQPAIQTVDFRNESTLKKLYSICKCDAHAKSFEYSLEIFLLAISVVIQYFNTNGWIHITFSTYSLNILPKIYEWLILFVISTLNSVPYSWLFNQMKLISDH